MQNNRTLFSIMFADGTLWQHLAEIDKEAGGTFSRLVSEMTQSENVNEELKATDQMAWVGRMNNIRNRAEEIVMKEFITQ